MVVHPDPAPATPVSDPSSVLRVVEKKSPGKAMNPNNPHSPPPSMSLTPAVLDVLDRLSPASPQPHPPSISPIPLSPARPAPGDGNESTEWGCHFCTFLNTSRAGSCVMCGNKRDSAPAESVADPSKPVPQSPGAGAWREAKEEAQADEAEPRDSQDRKSGSPGAAEQGKAVRDKPVEEGGERKEQASSAAAQELALATLDGIYTLIYLKNASSLQYPPFFAQDINRITPPENNPNTPNVDVCADRHVYRESGGPAWISAER